jgi:penicillin-binding protein 1C
VSPRAQATYWLADRTYLGRTLRGESLSWLPPHPGHYALRAVDDRGTADERDIDIEALP